MKSLAAYRPTGIWHSWTTARVVVVLSVAIGLGWLLPNDYLRDIVIMALLWGGLATCWNILGGMTGLLSLGHAAYMGIGAYVTAVLYSHYGWGAVVTLPIGMLMAGLFGAVLARACGRLSGIMYAITTFAAAQVLLVGIKALGGVTGGAQGLALPISANKWSLVFESRSTYLVLMCAYVMLCIGVSEYLDRSKFGLQFRAIREDDIAAQAYGVSRSLVQVTSTGVSAALTALGGSIYALYTLVVSPDTVFGIVFTNNFVLAAVIGGMATLWGPLLGGSLFIGISILLRGLVGVGAAGGYMIALGAVLVFVVVFYPAGLAGAMKRLGARSRRLAASGTRPETNAGSVE